MPNWKNPCQHCKGCVRKNQKYLICSGCNKRVHFRCTELTEIEFQNLIIGSGSGFSCNLCKLSQGLITSANVEEVNDNCMPPSNSDENVEDLCLECNHQVKNNDYGIMCDTCKRWVHLSCTNFSMNEYTILQQNEEVPFYCLSCNARASYASQILDTSINDVQSQLEVSSSSIEFSDAHSSDFEFVDTDSESDLRGLNFDSLPKKSFG